MSAIPVIAKTLTDMRLLHRDIGQLTQASGTVDVVVGWFLLSIVAAAATIGVGMRAWLSVAGGVDIAILGKFAGAHLGARLSRLGHWEGLALGAGMNARGVIEVIVATTGLRLGVLNTATYTVVVLVAIVTSLMAPPLLRTTMRRIAQNDEELLRKAEHDAWAGKTGDTRAEV